MTKNALDWSDEERERAQAILDGDARSVQTPQQDPTTIPAERCRIWRNYVAQGKHTPHDMPSTRALRTIERHVNGGCQHDIGRVGLPCEYTESSGWERVGLVSEQYKNKARAVVHTRECRCFPEGGVVRVGGLEQPGVELAVCRFCKETRVPEASPIEE